MGSFSGILQRPLLAAATVAVAFVSSHKLPFHTSSDTSSSTCNSLQQPNPSWLSHNSLSKLANLSFLTTIRVPLPNINFPVPDSGLGRNFVPNFFYSSSYVASSPALLNLYQSAELAKAPKPSAYGQTISTLPSEVMYRWHLPEPNAIDVSDCSSEKSRTVVVLLGWLGAKQKHLNRYAELYTSRGFHVITFTFPMTEILSYQFGGKAEEHVDLLVNHLADWLEEEHGKNLVFHTFSNTGWLTLVHSFSPIHPYTLFLFSALNGTIFLKFLFGLML
jgi:hypothetical protein